MERLDPLGTAFLEAEDADPHTSMAIASVATFEGPPPPFDEFVALIADRVPLVPKYRQVVRRVPFDLGAPFWVDDPRFDVHWHVRRTALPSPGGPRELNRFVGRVMSQRMDRGRPLWEYWVIEGLEGDRWALLSKVHHSMVDGVAGTDLYRSLFGTPAEPDPGRSLGERWLPGPPPSTLHLTVLALRDLALNPVTQLRAVVSALLSPVALAGRVADTVTGTVRMAGAILPARSSTLTGPIGQQRRYASTLVSLDEIRVVRQQLGGTVNDVALAAVAGGFRELLLARGEQPAAHAVRSLVPVSVRPPGHESELDNQVSLMLPYLPVELDDAVARLDAVRERLDALRSGHEAEAGETLTSVAGYQPFFPVAAGTRLVFHFPQRQIVTVTTNVPGLRETLVILGRRAERITPFVPIADRVRIGIAISSYAGELTFGITGDYDTAPDIDVLARAIDASFAELLAAAKTAAR